MIEILAVTIGSNVDECGSSNEIKINIQSVKMKSDRFFIKNSFGDFEEMIKD